MSIRTHIFLMIVWRAFWPAFGAIAGFAVGALLLKREFATFVAVLLGVFLGMGVGYSDALKRITVRCPKCGERAAQRTSAARQWNYRCQACQHTIKTGWHESDPSDRSDTFNRS